MKGSECRLSAGVSERVPARCLNKSNAPYYSSVCCIGLLEELLSLILLLLLLLIIIMLLHFDYILSDIYIMSKPQGRCSHTHTDNVACERKYFLKCEKEVRSGSSWVMTYHNLGALGATKGGPESLSKE